MITADWRPFAFIKMAKRAFFFGWCFTSKSIIAVCHVTSLQISYFGLVTTKQYSPLQNLQSQEIG